MLAALNCSLVISMNSPHLAHNSGTCGRKSRASSFTSGHENPKFSRNSSGPDGQFKFQVEDGLPSIVPHGHVSRAMIVGVDHDPVAAESEP